MIEYELNDLSRRVANLVRIGTIKSVDGSIARARVQIGALVTARLPWLTARAGSDRTWWQPSVGEQVVVLSPSGELAQGVILPSVNQLAHPAPESSATVSATHYADGAVVKYDTDTHSLSAVLPAGGSAELVADGGITLKGPVTIIGDITHTGTQTTSDDVIASGKSLKSHTHTDTAGTGAGTTSSPN